MTARVTVGVPVRNGEQELQACLECLSNQTFRDVEIIVLDNASTDRTPEIVARAMQDDPRIRCIRHDANIGVLANFRAALDVASSPYFMWRAYDDLSDPRYIETLVAALDAHPEAMLAAPRVDTLRTRTGKRRVRLPPTPKHAQDHPLAAGRRMIRQQQAGWFYGLFRREFLLDTFTFSSTEYHFAWACDHIMLATIAMRAAVVGVPDAVLTLQLTGAPKEYSSSEMVAERTALARNYWQVLEQLLLEKKLPLLQRLLYRASFVWHMQRRVAKWPILWRALAGGNPRSPSSS